MKSPFKFVPAVRIHPVLRSGNGALAYSSVGRGILDSQSNVFPVTLNAAGKLVGLTRRGVGRGIQVALHNILHYYTTLFGLFAPYVGVLIIRGIGYRASIVYNHDTEYFLDDSS